MKTIEREQYYKRLFKLESEIKEKEYFIKSPMPPYYNIFANEAEYKMDIKIARSVLAMLKKKVDNILKKLAYESN